MNLRMLGIATVAVMLPTAAIAQEHQGCACCSHSRHETHGAAAPSADAPTGLPHSGASSGSPTYETEYEGLVAGVVYSVMRHAGMDVQLTLSVGESTLEVVVAPMEWLDRQLVAFRPGQFVEVIGARGTASAADPVVAREIRTGGQTLVLRDTAGVPRWND